MEKLKTALSFAFLNFGPLIIFYGLNHFAGLKAAIFGTVVFSVIEIAYRIYRREKIPALFKYSVAMTLIFGAIDLYAEKSFLFKYEASVTNLLTAGFFAMSLFSERSILQEYYERNPNAKPITKALYIYFRWLTMVWVTYFVLKAVAYLWIAQAYSLEQGLLIRTVVGSASFYALMAVSIFGGRRIVIALKKWQLLPQDEDCNVERKAFVREAAPELIEFGLADPHHPARSRRLIERFLGQLTSNENLVFDYHFNGERVLSAALVDEVQNPSNAASLSVFGFKSGPYAPAIFDKLLEDAKAALPKTRAGIEVSFNVKVAFSEELLRAHGFQPLYKTFEMSKVDAEHPAVPELAAQYRWQTINESLFREYYDLITLAFAKNLETSIPPFAELKIALAQSKFPATLLLHNDRVIALISLAVDENEKYLGDVHMIGLHPDYRGQGLGSVLLAQALEQLHSRGCRRYQLTVAAANAEALHLYKKFGFKIVDEDHCFLYTRVSY